MSHVKARVTVLALVLALPAVAAAQTTQPFDFLNPGARSLALGSAFAGLADDATSAFTNPAGLLILRAPELSFEVRNKHDDYASPGFQNYTAPSYVSFVFPARTWAVAGYRRQFGRIREGYSDPEFGSFDFSLKSAAYGVSAAAGLGPRVKVGGGFAAYQVEMTSGFTIPGLPAYVDEVDETKLGFNLGGLVTPISEPRGAVDLFQIGAVYRRTPAYDISSREGASTIQTLEEGLNLPDSFTVGAALRFKGAATVVLDYTHIDYGFDYLFSSDQKLDEYHVGFEYVLQGMKWPPALRVGTWRESDFNSTGSDQGTEYLQHLTFGGGFSPHKAFDVNAGFDFSKQSRVFSVSAVVRVMK